MPDTTLRAAAQETMQYLLGRSRNGEGDRHHADALRAALATSEPSVSVEAAGPSVTWTAANWTPTHRPVMVLLAPIGDDGRCTGCGVTPSRETGSCRCPKRLDAALRASVTPPPLDVDVMEAALQANTLDFIDQPDSFDTRHRVAVNLVAHYDRILAARLGEAHDD